MHPTTLLTRTNRFKQWFGDWEKAAKKRAIDSIEPEIAEQHSYSEEELRKKFFELEPVEKMGQI